MSTPESWIKPRDCATRFTPAEIELVRKAHADGRPVKDVARELRCSVRTVEVRYAKLSDKTCQGTLAAVRRDREGAFGMPHNGRSLCIRGGCEAKALAGAKTCAGHVFRPPANAARLMGARA